MVGSRSRGLSQRWLAVAAFVLALAWLVYPGSSADARGAAAFGFARGTDTAQTPAASRPIDDRKAPTDSKQLDNQNAQSTSVPASSWTKQTATPDTQTIDNSDQSPVIAGPMNYNLWVLAPAGIAIVLAVFTRQVVPSLVVGVLVGAFMMLPYLSAPAEAAFGGSNRLVAGVRVAAEYYVMGTMTGADGDGHLKIIVFTLVIGFVVGVIGRNGGTQGMVALVAGNAKSPRRGALTAWLAGLVVFFDDYANTMIVGPTMRSVFDRLKISRAKLAYIVDSTSAPVASLALIGTWVGTEVSAINQGLQGLPTDHVPAFLMTGGGGGAINGMQAFVNSLPYRFYPILTLALVFFVALTGRDFGPMKRAQRNAVNDRQDFPYEATSSKVETSAPPTWWLGLIPVLILVFVTIAVLIATGYHTSGGANIMAQDISFWKKTQDIINSADSYLSIFYGAILSAFTAIVLTLLARTCSMRDAFDAGLEGMARIFPAVVILVLAWALSQVSKDLKLGDVMVAHLQAMHFPIAWLPLAIFIAAAVISFATGTAWGTMAVLCPITVTLTVGLAAKTIGLEPATAQAIFYAAVGSVLAGAVFGDHCSPISDTTILSSIASGCRHEEHVWTQMPYAVVTAFVAMGLGNVLCSVYGQPWYVGLGAGSLLLFIIVLLIGRKPTLDAQPPIVSQVHVEV